MIAGVPLWAVLVIAAVVAVGAFVQATLGLGLGLLGAPLIALIEPALVPTLLLLLAVPVSCVVLWIERHHVSWRVIRWALPSRIPGTVLGVWLATTFDDRALGVVVAVMVLLAVWLSFHAIEVPQTPTMLVGAGLAAGTAGTATAIGGPPMAIVMAHRPPREVRGTLSFFFVVGSVFSVLLFQAQGELPEASVALAVGYLPILAVMSWAGHRAHRRLPRETFRRVVLALCAASATVLLVKSLLG